MKKKLIHNKKEVLSNMKYATSIFEISWGLMFASKNKIRKGACLVMPSQRDGKFGSSITMMFCFHKMEILFVNTEKIVVDKVVLRSWKITYTPQKPCKYVIESLPNTFKNIKIGDKVSIE